MRKERDEPRIRVLAIMPGEDERDRLNQTAEGEPWCVEFCTTVVQALELLRGVRSFAAVVLDRDAPGINWEGAVGDLAAVAPMSRVLLASSGGGDELWQRVVEHGGHDLVSKPFRAGEVRRAVLHAHWYASTVQTTRPIS